jgi:hypothetical protein
MNKITLLLHLLILGSVSVTYFYSEQLFPPETTEAPQSTTIETETEYKLEAVSSDFADWIVNQNVLQYGTIASKQSNGKQVEIEVMIHSFREDVFKETSELKCLIRLNPSLLVLKRVAGVYLFETVRVKCELTGEEFSKVVNDKLTVGVFDSRDGLTHIFGREAAFFNRNAPKLKSLKICTSNLSKLSRQTLLDLTVWIEMQRSMGVSEIEIHSSDTQSKYFAEMKKKSR